MNNNSIRHISLTDRIVLSWKGNIFRRAIALADVDNDGDNELIVGSLEGNLAIFKGMSEKPWKTSSNLGSISCISCGDLGNSGRKLIIVISSEGICNIYDICEQQLHYIESNNNIINNNNNNNNNNIILQNDQISDNSSTNSSSLQLPPSSSLQQVQQPQILSSPNLIVDENYEVNNYTQTVSINESTITSSIINNSTTSPVSLINSSTILTSSTIATATTTEIIENNSVDIQNDYEINNIDSPDNNNENININNTNNNISNNNNNNNPTISINNINNSPSILYEDNILIPILTQRLPPNASSILIGDIDDDGLNELVIGTYDHTLFSFSLKDLSSKNLDENNVINNQENINNSNDSLENNNNNSNNISNSNNNNNNNSNRYSLVIKNKWQLPGQIGSLVLAKELGENILIVGLCEGTNYIILNKKGQLYKEGANEYHHQQQQQQQHHHHSDPGLDPVIASGSGSNIFSPALSGVVGNNSGNNIINNVSSSVTSNNSSTNNTSTAASNLESLNNLTNRKKRTEIITNISCPIRMDFSNENDSIQDDQKKSSIVSIATLDGILRLQKIGKGIVWKMEIEEMGSGQLISLQTIQLDNQNKLINNNNSNSNKAITAPTTKTANDFIVACGWDGLTLVVDPKQRNVISYKFGDRVCAFTSGSYSLTKGTFSNCFIYVTFFGEIIIYYDIALNIQPVHSLTFSTKSEWSNFQNDIKSTLSNNNINLNNNYDSSPSSSSFPSSPLNKNELDQSEIYNLLLSSQNFNLSKLKDYLSILQNK